MPAPSVQQNDSSSAAKAGKASSASGESLPPPKLESIDVEKAIERLNELSDRARRDLHFRVDHDSGRTVITVTNARTAEIVRQIPAEELLAIARMFADLGRLIDTEA